MKGVRLSLRELLRRRTSLKKCGGVEGERQEKINVCTENKKCHSSDFEQRPSKWTSFFFFLSLSLFFFFFFLFSLIVSLPTLQTGSSCTCLFFRSQMLLLVNFLNCIHVFHFSFFSLSLSPTFPILN